MYKKPMIVFDTETKSGYDLELVGRVKYVTHPDADIICLSWKHYGAKGRAKLWAPGYDVPEPFLSPADFTFCAFNIQFDSLILETLGDKYGFQILPYENQNDIMAVAARLSLPQKLDLLGKALEVELPKLRTGSDLKKIFCYPPYRAVKKGEQENRQLLQSFYEYCMRDTDCLEQIMQALPTQELPENEKDIWVRNCRMNRHGIAVDVAGIKLIREVMDKFRSKLEARVPYVTGGRVKTIGQIQVIKDYCKEAGVDMPDLSAATVTETLKEALFDDVRELLELRQILGGSAIKKYARMDAQTYQGRIHDNSRYHGAGTGRTTGGGVQLLNLPRAVLPHDKGADYDMVVNDMLERFKTPDILDDPQVLHYSKAMVRPMLIAGPKKKFIVLDWGSIEYILLMWSADEQKYVREFRKGLDPYKTFASEFFGLPYEEVSKEQRNFCKPPVLGCGYVLSSGGLIAYAKQYRVDLTPDKAQQLVDFFRGTRRKVVQSWWDLYAAAKHAVLNPGTVYTANNTKFRVVKGGKFSYLIMTLPSGRNLFYAEPRVELSYGYQTITHMGIHPTTKQWVRIVLKAPRVIENKIQGLGRDILEAAHAKITVPELDRRVVGTVYDELIVEVPDLFGQDELEQQKKIIETIMCTPPTWAPDLPLKVEGYICSRYRKE